jgi:hypothetical protein
MKRLLRNVSVLLCAALANAADLTYWVEPCTHPETHCMASDTDLARWAMQAWQEASGGRLHLSAAKDEAHARIRLTWASATQGLYGETRAIAVDGQRGSQIYVVINPEGSSDPLLRDTIVYLTCLHESGHALGLSHTAAFDDIMYSFQFGGDIPEYFARYRRRLSKRDDIRKNSGLSPADRQRLIESIARSVAGKPGELF